MLKRIIKKNKNIYQAAIKVFEVLHSIGIKYFYKFTLKKDFTRLTGEKLHLDNPRTFNEKMQWLKCYYRNPIMTECADKIAVRSIVAKKIGSEYLTLLYGIYNGVDEIELDKLPDSFVLKTNHSSGRNIICFNKNKMNWKNEFSKLRKWMKENYYYQNGEWVYKDIKPKILCEELLKGEIIDYKFMCFYGKPEYVLVCSERKIKLKVTCVDTNFKKLPFSQYFPTSETLKKPKNFEEMVKLSEILSKEFPLVRVDFYNQAGKIYFGELTFFDSNGMAEYKPKEWNVKIGNMLDLNKINKAYIKR